MQPESIIADVNQKDYRSLQNHQSYSATTNDQRFSLVQAIEGYLLSCKVEGKSLSTILAYKAKLYPFLWYCNNYNLPNSVSAINTQQIREFMAYLRDNTIRFGGTNIPSRKPVNKTTIQRYYRVLSTFWNWLITEEFVTENPLMKIRTPKAERKVVRGLSAGEVNNLIATFDNSFDGKRNRAMVLILVDCGLRLGELLRLSTDDVDMSQQLIKVTGKTGERTVRFGMNTAKSLLKYVLSRNGINCSNKKFWLTSKGNTLTDSAIESIFKRLSESSGIRVHPHLLR